MRRKPEAICTAALIAVNAAVFLVLSLFGDTEDPAFMLRHGAMYEEYVIRGREYYRLFTCLFLHFGIEHLLNNMVLLGALGWNLEAVTGKVRFLVIYFGSGLAGNLLSLFFNRASGENVVSAGASGAIFGLMGALLYVVIVNRGRLGRLAKCGRPLTFGTHPKSPAAQSSYRYRGRRSKCRTAAAYSSARLHIGGPKASTPVRAGSVPKRRPGSDGA